jgi:hypothetical protein
MPSHEPLPGDGPSGPGKRARLSTCGRTFRAQPPFLRPRGIYTRRVIQKAVESVYRDGLAARKVPDRLARDFWVRPSEKSPQRELLRPGNNALPRNRMHWSDNDSPLIGSPTLGWGPVRVR